MEQITFLQANSFSTFVKITSIFISWVWCIAHVLKETFQPRVSFVLWFLLCVLHSLFPWECVSLKYSLVYAKCSVCLICRNINYWKLFYSLFLPILYFQGPWSLVIYIIFSHIPICMRPLDKLLAKSIKGTLKRNESTWKYHNIVFLEQKALPCLKMCSDTINGFNSFSFLIKFLNLKWIATPGFGQNVSD